MSTDLIQILQPNINTYVGLMSKNLIPNTPKDQIFAIVQQELENLSYLSMFKPEIRNCDPETIKYAVRKVIMQNLSFDPDLGLVHLTTRKMEVNGVKGVTVLECKPTVNGYISLYKQAGSLERVNPTMVTYDETTRLVNLVHVELVVPVHDARGNVIGRDVIPFNFTQDDFKKWEKASHKQNSRGKKPDEINNETLNCANPLYSNYYPLQNNAVHRYEKKGGIDPAFAITKCIKHALERAKLDKNPYAKRVFGVVHEKVVSPDLEENETFEEYEVVKDAPPVSHQTQTQSPPPTVVTSTPVQPPVVEEKSKEAAQPIQQTPPPPPVVAPPPVQQVTTPPPVAPPASQPAASIRKNDQYYLMVDACTTPQQVTDLYVKNESVFKSDEELVKYLKKQGNKLMGTAAQNPVVAPPLVVTPPPAQTASTSMPSASDL